MSNKNPSPDDPWADEGFGGREKSLQSKRNRCGKGLLYTLDFSALTSVQCYLLRTTNKTRYSSFAHPIGLCAPTTGSLRTLAR